MLITVLKSKIYKAKLTDVSLEYSGSFGIDKKIMDEVGISRYEKLLIVNTSTGDRFETYAIEEPEGSERYSLYGGAARLGMKGDLVIVMAFTQIEAADASSFKPKVFNY